MQVRQDGTRKEIMVKGGANQLFARRRGGEEEEEEVTTTRSPRTRTRLGPYEVGL